MREHTGSRAAAGWAEPLFWTGLLVLVMPFTARLASTAAPRRERVGLVVLLALALYLVKVVHSPYAFTFPDEFELVGNRNSVQAQLGNSVPPLLAQKVISQVAEVL